MLPGIVEELHAYIAAGKMQPGGGGALAGRIADADAGGQVSGGCAEDP